MQSRAEQPLAVHSPRRFGRSAAWPPTLNLEGGDTKMKCSCAFRPVGMALLPSLIPFLLPPATQSASRKYDGRTSQRAFPRWAHNPSAALQHLQQHSPTPKSSRAGAITIRSFRAVPVPFNAWPSDSGPANELQHRPALCRMQPRHRQRRRRRRVHRHSPSPGPCGRCGSRTIREWCL